MIWPRTAGSYSSPAFVLQCTLTLQVALMTPKDIEKIGMYFHGTKPCISPSIAGWALGDLGDSTTEPYRRIVTRLGSVGQISGHLPEVTCPPNVSTCRL